MLLDNKSMIILENFISDYSKRIYGRDIARKLKMNQKTVSNILNKLEKENILKFEMQGKNKYYFLNKFNPQIKEIIKLIEINKKMRFLREQRDLEDLFNKLEKRTKGILVVFGSYADFSANKESDIDLFLIGTISDFRDLEKMYSKKINIIKSTKNKFNYKEHLIKEIINNHVILKGVEDFIELLWKQ